MSSSEKKLKVCRCTKKDQKSEYFLWICVNFELLVDFDTQSTGSYRNRNNITKALKFFSYSMPISPIHLEKQINRLRCLATEKSIWRQETHKSVSSAFSRLLHAFNIWFQNVSSCLSFYTYNKYLGFTLLRPQSRSTILQVCEYVKMKLMQKFCTECAVFIVRPCKFLQAH